LRLKFQKLQPFPTRIANQDLDGKVTAILADSSFDRSRNMEERSWWDLWNTSHRTKDNNDPISSELFDRTAAIVNRITRRGAGRVLEIACGAGSFSRKLSCTTYHGIDISPAAIDLARQRSLQTPLPDGSTPPTYEAADFHEWPLLKYELDLVVCVDAVAYFRDQAFVMKKMAQSLRPGGKLVLTTINPFVYDRIRRNQFVRLESGPVNYCLSRSALHALLKQSGFSIERSFSIMPRGELGILRITNSYRLNESFGSRVAAVLKRLKEQAGLGQYRVVVARKI
jgi:2-polyprenyl-3-methyl-5-hydroxy-6-metoxy-1,4-benzoquinol methylase